MKFQCDRCKTRYAIADEKVRGKVLKIRCKSCEAIITVRDAAAPPASEPPRPAPGAAAPLVSATGGKKPARAATHTIQLSMSSPAMVAAAATSSLEEWYLSVDGKQEGPFNPEEAQKRVSKRPLGSEMFAWRDDFEEWLPVEQVPILAVHLPRHTPPSNAVVASLPVAPPDQTGPGKQPSAPAPKVEPAATSSDDNFDFNIGEASRLVKLPILPPPSARASSGDALPGMSASAPAVAVAEKDKAEASLKLPIASLSTEMAPVRNGAAASSAAPARVTAPKRVAAAERASSSAVPPPKRRRVSTPIIVAGVATLGIVAVVGLFYSQDPQDVRRPDTGEAPDNTLVTNFYSKENPLFNREPAKPAEKPPEVEIVDSSAESPAAPDGKPHPRGAPFQRRTAAVLPTDGQVNLEPVTRPDPPPRMGAPSREKVDSFEADRADVEGPLTPDDVRRTYAANEVGLKRCYERSLKSDPAGNVSKMVVKITIQPGGGISDIAVPDRSSDLGNCVTNSIRAWHFRRSPSEFTTEFTVYFAKRG